MRTRVLAFVGVVALMVPAIGPTGALGPAESPPCFSESWSLSHYTWLSDVAFDGTDYVYVATGFHYVVKVTPTGTVVDLLGGRGTGDGEFGSAWGVAVDSLGNLYVTDGSLNDRVQKFDSNGNFLTKWGSFGAGDGQFDYPFKVEVDGSDNVYVVDLWNHRVQKFDSDGNFLTKWGGNGTGDGEFIFPYGVAIDAADNVYVTDAGNHRVQKFDSNGNFLTKWGSEGSGDSQFIYPQGVAVDGSGFVYVVDRGNNRVQKFTSDGVFVTSWGSEGTGDGQFVSPHGIGVDPSGVIYVTETYPASPARVQKFGACVPVADVGGPYLVPVGGTVMFDGSASEDPEGEALAYAWTVDGGTLDDATLEAPTYTPTAAGIFDVGLTVSDPGGLSGTASTYVVVYDPSGGFATGAGHINSPPGAYVTDPSVSGKAVFGFVSRYQKGAATPDGHTQFIFTAGDLRFTSNSYQWLVVTQGGTNAQFKGTGLINGDVAPSGGEYGFMIWAKDSDPDTFRIRIWWETTDGVEHDVYDNGADQPISAGKITVHIGGR